jgi:hypothetical protein
MNTKKSNIDIKDVVISDRVKSEMTLVVADQQFIKRALDLLSDNISEEFNTLSNNIAEKLLESDNKMLSILEKIGMDISSIMLRLDGIERRLDAIEDSLSDKDKRLAFLERYASLPQTILRHAIAIFVGITIGGILGWFLHSLI